MKKYIWLLICVGVCLSPLTGYADGHLSIDDWNAEGCESTFTISVEVSDTTNAIEAFGFVLDFTDNFGDNIYSLNSFSAGTLTSGWLYLEATDDSFGHVTVGGADFTPIPAGADGTLIELTFMVTCPWGPGHGSCTYYWEDHGENVIFTDLVDDVAGYTTSSATFYYNCDIDSDLISSSNEACHGETTTFSVSAPCSESIDRFSFHAHFDPTNLIYQGYSVGTPLADWSTVSVTETTNEVIFYGDIREGGTPVLPGSYTPLISFDFEVDCPACSEETIIPDVITFSDVNDEFYTLNRLIGGDTISGNVTVTCPGGDIEAADVNGCEGIVQVPITIENNVNTIRQFTFNLSYDNTMLSFDSVDTGALTSDWILLTGITVDPPGNIASIEGTIDYEGSEIPIGSSGTIAVVNFSITCLSCTTGQSCSLDFSGLDDLELINNDLENYSPTSGSFTYTCPSVEPVIYVGDGFGLEGEAVSIPVMISEIPGELDKFGFDISYCEDMLTFVDCSPGTLVTGWSNFDYNETTSETVRIAGFDSTQSLPSGASGTLAFLNFSVSCPTCTGGETCELDISNLTDDMEFWANDSGIFTFLAEALPIPATNPAGNVLMIMIVSAFIVVFTIRKK